MRHLVVLVLSLGLVACGGGGGSGSDNNSSAEGSQDGGMPTTPDESSSPASPTGGAIVQDVNGNAVISWIDNSDDETGFLLQRKVGDQAEYQSLVQVGANETVYTDDSVISGERYSYRIFSIRNGDSSESYTEVTLTITNTGQDDAFAKAYQFGEDQIFNIFKIVPLADGEAIVLGGSDNSDMFISRIDATGEPVWNRYVEAEDAGEWFSESWLHSSQELYVVGQLRPDPESADQRNLGLARLILDPNTGEILSQKYLRLADIQVYEVNPSDEDNDGVYESLILVTQNFPDSDFFVLKTDLDLNVKWSKEITELDARRAKVASAPDGSVYLGAMILEPAYPADRYLYLAKFDIGGNLVFQRNIKFGDEVPEIDFYSMHTIAAGDEPGNYRVVLSGSAQFEPMAEYPLNFDTWFLGLDSSGQTAWRKRIETDLFFDVWYQGMDKPLLIGGSTEASAYYGAITADGTFEGLRSVVNEIELDIENAALLDDGSRLFDIETDRFDPSYVGIIAKVDAENSIPRLANGLVAGPLAVDSLDFPVQFQVESFNVVDWAVGAPIDTHKRNSLRKIFVTDLVGQ